MKSLFSISELPRVPAVYVMYGGRGRGKHVAYVGVAKSLKRRIEQHLVRRDSSVTTGASAVALNPDQVIEVHWWEHPDFAKRGVLEAAELIAAEVYEPVLRSRGATTEKARQLYDDERFREGMRSLFAGEPTGRLVIQTLQDALERIAALEQRVSELEEQLKAEPKR